jgi:hypothetical protein
VIYNSYVTEGLCISYFAGHVMICDDNVTLMVGALLGSEPIGTPRCARTTVEQRGYATRF